MNHQVRKSKMQTGTYDLIFEKPTTNTPHIGGYLYLCPSKCLIQLFECGATRRPDTRWVTLAALGKGTRVEGGKGAGGEK